MPKAIGQRVGFDPTAAAAINGSREPTKRAPLPIDPILERGDGSDGPPATVYYLFTRDHKLLYVGVSASALGLSRFKQHAGGKDWWTEVAYISVEHFPNRVRALNREAAAIARLNPRHNIARPNQKECACGICGDPPPHPSKGAFRPECRQRLRDQGRSYLLD